VQFWGTKQYDSIGTEFGPKRNISQAKNIENSDPACHAQNGVIGFRITTYRTFFIDDAEVKREPFNTSYRASPNVICTAGSNPTPKPTKTKKPTATATASATPSETPTT
jgi:hypothetical protein